MLISFLINSKKTESGKSHSPGFLKPLESILPLFLWLFKLKGILYAVCKSMYVEDYSIIFKTGDEKASNIISFFFLLSTSCIAKVGIKLKVNS